MPILSQELDTRYNALLQMYGEKEEQVQELKLDLQDVKDMYKSQVLSFFPASVVLSMVHNDGCSTI